MLVIAPSCSDDSGSDDNTKTDASAVTEAKGSGNAKAKVSAHLGIGSIGVSDLDASQDFYNSLLGLTPRYYRKLDKLEERVLHFEGSDKGADIGLMHYDDDAEHDYANHPVRLVFYVADVGGTIEKIRERGLRIVSEPHPEPTFHDAIIGLGLDLDGYIIELIEDQALEHPYLASIGLGVSDLDKAKSFYVDTLGMEVDGDPIKVPNVWDEWLLKYPKSDGSGLVLMHYSDGKDHDYADLPVKTTHVVPDTRALTKQIEEAGLEVVSPIERVTLDNATVLSSISHDHDGYTLELVTP